MKELIEKDALELAKENYTEYCTYVAQGRSYPRLEDGCKSAYKRAIYGMWKECPRSIIKVAKLAAAALPYHPHPTSISGVIIQLGENGNKLKLMDTQGNWGDSSKGIQPSAERYIGGMLSDLAIELLCDSMDYTPKVTGEIDELEPIALPTFLPLCFINGQSGIPAGLPRLNIPALNLLDMFDYSIDVLQHKDVNFQSKKLPKPNLGVDVLSSVSDWEDILNTGKGSIKVAPRMELKDSVITITALPDSKTVESARKIVEKEILLDKIDFRDESTYTTSIVIEKVPHKQCDMNELYKRLYNKLSTSESYNFAFFDDTKIYVPCSYRKVIRANLEYLLRTHTERINNQLADTKLKLLVLQIIEKLDVRNIATLNYADSIVYIKSTFNVDDDIAVKVLQKPISYLTRAHSAELMSLETKIKELETDKSDVYEVLIRKMKELKKKVNDKIKNSYVETRFI